MRTPSCREHRRVMGYAARGRKSMKRSANACANGASASCHRAALRSSAASIFSSAASFNSQPQPYGRSNEARCGPESVASSPTHMVGREPLLEVLARCVRASRAADEPAVSEPTSSACAHTNASRSCRRKPDVARAVFSARHRCRATGPACTDTQSLRWSAQCAKQRQRTRHRSCNERSRAPVLISWLPRRACPSVGPALLSVRARQRVESTTRLRSCWRRCRRRRRAVRYRVGTRRPRCRAPRHASAALQPAKGLWYAGCSAQIERPERPLRIGQTFFRGWLEQRLDANAGVFRCGPRAFDDLR